MKLLIADDEKLTREGIRDSLDLEALGISGVFLADDGVHGLETALGAYKDSCHHQYHSQYPYTTPALHLCHRLQ